MTVVVLVAGIVLVVGLVVAVLVTVLVRKSRRVRAELNAELATEPAVRGPESAVYRGSTGSYSKVAGNGHIALTARRLVFRKVTGGAVDVPVADITGVTQEKVFNRSVQGGYVHLVVHTHHGAVAYYVSDLDGWTSAVEAARRA